MFIQVKCHRCGYEGTAIITECLGRKVVMDACYKCGMKTTNEQECELNANSGIRKT